MKCQVSSCYAEPTRLVELWGTEYAYCDECAKAKLTPGSVYKDREPIVPIGRKPGETVDKLFTQMDDAQARKETNPKDRAASARLDLSLFPASAKAYGALALTEGDLKYGGYNYRAAGVRASVYYAAAGRHLDKWYNGEEYDQTTRVPHLANALACLAVLIDSIEQGNMNDDRPPRQDVTALLAMFEERVKHLQATFPNPPGRVTQKGEK